MIRVFFAEIVGFKTLIDAVDLADQYLADGIEAKGCRVNMLLACPLNKAAGFKRFAQLAPPLAEQAVCRYRPDHLR
ncbi:MAG: hypothetical protein EOP20_15305 [Hyphomicrobiales bacterium]|nr:MAG: hypothetical protein EOP20_15305 [Hyphomicrobiales bacterium]